MKYSWNLKKTIIVILSALFAVCIMFAGITANKANANTDLEPVTLSSTMQESAEMRLTNPTGMRFITNVNTADLELFNADNVKVVTMITQKNLLDAKGISVEDFNKDSDVKKGEVTFTAAKLAGIEAVEGKIKLIATLMEVNDVNITKEYVAKTYITDGEKIGYIGKATQASIFEVATYWAEQGLGAEDETTQAILDRYTKSCTVTIAGVPEGIKVPYGSKLSETLFYGMPECYTIVSIKDANGADVDKDLVVTEDLALTIEMTVNHSWKDGKCTVANCGEDCYHDWNGADCTICDMTREPSVADTTYSVEYLAIADGAVTVDLESINETVVADEITAVAVNGTAAEWTVDDNGDLVITTATYGENVAVAITVANAEEYKTVTFKTIVATHAFSTTDAFVAYLKSDRSNTLAVITSNIEMPGGEVYQVPKASNFSIIGVGESKPVINGWRETVGMFRNGGSGITLKNLNINFPRACSTIFGHGFSGALNIIDVDVTAYFEGGTTRAWLVYDCKSMTLNMTDCEFNITMTSSKLENTYCLGASWSGSAPGYTLDTSNTYNFTNTIVNTTGVIGSHGDNFTFTNCDIKETVNVTYADKYVVTDGTTFAIDASKIEGVTVTGVTSAIVGGTACTASQSGNTISINSTNKGEIKVKLVATDKIYAFNTIIANFVLSDEATFKAWVTAGHGTAGGKYAVISQDITLTADIELNTPWFGGWTLNGLGHTVKNIYDYSGFMSGGAGGVTIKNVTLNMKTCSSAFGDDWYGTNNFENVKIAVSVPGHAGTSRLLFDRVRADTVFNFKNCEFTFNIDSKLQANEMLLMKFDNSGIVVNLTNSTITSNGTIAALNSSIKLDATSSITDKNGTK